MTQRGIAIGAAVAAGLLGLGLGAWGVSRHAAIPREAAAVGAGDSLDAQIAALREQIAAERDARLGLEGEIAMLRQLVAESGAGARFDTPPPAGESAAGQSAAAAAGDAASPDAKPWFDEQALTAGGLSSPDIARLEEVFETSELEVLYLRDQATREGWLDTPRFLQAMYQLRSGLREQIGDENFDWLLYATHRDNRVVAQSVIASGPAARAGIQAGDVILRYDGRAIFRGGELQSATSQGEAGRPVTLEVLTPNGQLRRLTVPSGPLGVQLAAKRLPPRPGR